MGLFGGGNSRTSQTTYSEMNDGRVAAADSSTLYHTAGGDVALTSDTSLSNVGNTNYLDGGAIEGSFGFADRAFGTATNVVGSANANIAQVALQTQQSALGFGSEALGFGANAFAQAGAQTERTTNSALQFGERAFETVNAAGGQVVGATNSALQFGERAFETVNAAGGQVVDATKAALGFGEKSHALVDNAGKRELETTKAAFGFGEKSFEFAAASTGQAIDAVKAGANAALGFGEKSFEFGADTLGKTLSTVDKAISSSAGLVNKSFELIDSQGRAAYDFAKGAQASAAEGLATNTATLSKALDTARASNDEKLIQTIVPWIAGASAVAIIAMAWGRGR